MSAGYPSLESIPSVAGSTHGRTGVNTRNDMYSHGNTHSPNQRQTNTPAEEGEWNFTADPVSWFKNRLIWQVPLYVAGAAIVTIILTNIVCVAKGHTVIPCRVLNTTAMEIQANNPGSVVETFLTPIQSNFLKISTDFEHFQSENDKYEFQLIRELGAGGHGGGHSSGHSSGHSGGRSGGGHEHGGSDGDGYGYSPSTNRHDRYSNRRYGGRRNRYGNGGYGGRPHSYPQKQKPIYTNEIINKTVAMPPISLTANMPPEKYIYATGITLTVLIAACMLFLLFKIFQYILIYKQQEANGTLNNREMEMQLRPLTGSHTRNAFNTKLDYSCSCVGLSIALYGALAMICLGMLGLLVSSYVSLQPELLQKSAERFAGDDVYHNKSIKFTKTDFIHFMTAGMFFSCFFFHAISMTIAVWTCLKTVPIITKNSKITKLVLLIAYFILSMQPQRFFGGSYRSDAASLYNVQGIMQRLLVLCVIGFYSSYSFEIYSMHKLCALK